MPVLFSFLCGHTALFLRPDRGVTDRLACLSGLDVPPTQSISRIDMGIGIREVSRDRRERLLNSTEYGVNTSTTRHEAPYTQGSYVVNEHWVLLVSCVGLPD
ncbi:hypothetical protein K458DRAFT_13165 [Lentithecium fluviatile CBS 122367]|uniref:Uncharacterized protein n=1 Tax=Lentithecium fluviatile CBS 122367 TaxID=1168545 RepID=A0A6G1J4R0_9PLEO|nr:hypothetical protein K458DRAFT_13165 [Lentithecium fluviatile CBS 122367]